MTRHARTIIRSSIFSTVPVPPRDEVQYKGVIEETSGLSIPSSETLFVDENEAVEVNRASLRQALKSLVPLSSIPIRDLNPEQAEIFRSVVETLRLLYHSPNLYDMVLKDVKEIFGQGEVRPGTVGAFFRGCFTDNNFNGPLGCSPKCADSLPPPEGTPGHAPCDDLVLIYRGGDFHSLNERVSSHCYIYVEDPNFDSFSTENMNKLRDAGIEQVTLIYGNADGTYRQVVGPINTEAVPVSTTGENYAGAIIALVIMVLLVVMLFVLVVVRNGLY